MNIYRILILTTALFGSAANANECNCQPIDSTYFEKKVCPYVVSRQVSSAESIRLRFNSIEIRNLMSLIGHFSVTEMCLSQSISGNVSVRFDVETPWPVMVRSIARKNGWKAVINEKQILLLEK